MVTCVVVFGEARSGKGTLVKLIEEAIYRVVKAPRLKKESLASVLREIAPRPEGVSKEEHRNVLQLAGEKLRELHGKDALVILLLDRSLPEFDFILVDDGRLYNEVVAFKKYAGGRNYRPILIKIWADEKLREERFEKDSPGSYALFKETSSGDITETSLSSIADHNYDFIVPNNGTIGDLKDTVDRSIIEYIFN